MRYRLMDMFVDHLDYQSSEIHEIVFITNPYKLVIYEQFNKPECMFVVGHLRYVSLSKLLIYNAEAQ